MARTEKVRIALVIDDKGQWGAAGWNLAGGNPNPYNERMLEQAYDNAEEPSRPHAEHWIVAEVPVPEATEIAGEVEA